MSLSCVQPPLNVKLGIFTSLVKICKAQKLVYQLGGLYGSLKGNKQNLYNLNL